jgi:hypothetical protein
MRICGLIGVLAVWCAVPLGAQVPASRPDARPAEVRSIEIVGAGGIDPALVRATIETRETRCRTAVLLPVCALGLGAAHDRAFLDEATVREDEERLRLLLATQGFPSASVFAQIDTLRRGGVRVRFLADPGEPLVVRSIRIEGMESVEDRVDLPRLPIRVGDRLGLAPLETAQRVIAGRLAAAGYAFARVGVPGPLPQSGGPVDLVLEVRAGPLAEFGTTSIHSELPLRGSDLTGFLAFAPGDRFSTAALEQTVERLYRIPLIERVQVQPAPGTEGGSLVETDLHVTIAEPEGLQLEGAISSYACVEGVVGWASRYFLGRPRVVSVSAGASKLLSEPLRNFPCTGLGEDEFAEPDFFVRADLSQALTPDTWLNLGGGFSRESSPRAFIQRGAIARVSLVHELRRGIDITASYSPEHRDNPMAGPLYCALHGVCGGEELDRLTARNTLAPVELALAFGPPRARRIDPGAPLMAEWTFPPLPDWTYAGRIAFVGAARPMLSDFDFSRVIAEASLTRYPGRLYQLAGRARAGWLFGDGPLPPQVRLFGGGPFGVRGVEPNLLGPRLLTVAPARVQQLGCDEAGDVPDCDGIVVDPALVHSRPTGGTALVEATIEGRVWATPSLQLALFADFGVVRASPAEGEPGGSVRSESLHTPGVGILALTPIGPFRIDMAYDPSPPRTYPLLTRDEEGSDPIYLGEVVFDPYNHGDPTVLRKLRRRFQIQLSMRQAF